MNTTGDNLIKLAAHLENPFFNIIIKTFSYTKFLGQLVNLHV